MTRTPIAAQLERRRRAAAERWQLGGQIVVIGAGQRIPVPGRGDRIYPFRAHSEWTAPRRCSASAASGSRTTC